MTLNLRYCYICNEEVWSGDCEGCPIPDLSRRPITRDSAERLPFAVGVRRLFSGEVVEQFWRDTLTDEWKRLAPHNCKEWK